MQKRCNSIVMKSLKFYKKKFKNNNTRGLIDQTLPVYRFL